MGQAEALSVQMFDGDHLEVALTFLGLKHSYLAHTEHVQTANEQRLS